MRTQVKPNIEEYSRLHSEQVPILLQKLDDETHAKMHMAVMLTGALEGRFLKMLTLLTGAKRVLEIGMFTGYSALSMAEALPANGELITLEIDPKAIAFAKRYFQESEHGKKIVIKEGPALESIKQLNGLFDLVFIDADKVNYLNYYQAALPLVRKGGLIIADNVLYGGQVLFPEDENPRAINAFNKFVAKDDRVTCSMLPIRDGVSLIRKK